MADAPVVHIGENSPEFIAHRLMDRVITHDAPPLNRRSILDLYAECLLAVKEPGRRLTKAKPSQNDPYEERM